MRTLLLVTLIACTDPPTPVVEYDCVLLYRCQGDELMSVRQGVFCAMDADEANDQAQSRGLAEIQWWCEPPWQYLRTICTEAHPQNRCEP